MRYERYLLDEDKFPLLPTVAQVFYLALLRCSSRRDGAADVRVEGFEDECQGEVVVQNDRGEVRFVFGEDGELSELEWAGIREARDDRHG